MATDATTYALHLPNYRSMYESEFVKMPASGFSNQGGVASEMLLGLPLLMEVLGVAWMAIAEAGLRDYAGMCLVNPSKSWLGHRFESRFPPVCRINPPDACCSSATIPAASLNPPSSPAST